MLASSAALADLTPIPPGSAIVVGDATYVTAYPDASADATLLLTALSGASDINGGESAVVTLDGGLTLPINGAPLSATFAIMALNATGDEMPWPDPLSPTRPWIISVDALPEPILLPDSVKLYLRQLTSSDGYTVAPDLIPLTDAVPFGGTLTVSNTLADGLIEITANETVPFTITDFTGAETVSATLEPYKSWLGVLPAGEYLFTPHIPSEYIPIEPYGLTVTSGSVSRIDVVCEPMPQLSIRIQSVSFAPSGERVLAPVAGETVTLTATDGSVIRMQTDSNGLARRTDQPSSDTPTVLPGEYTLRAGREPERLILLESSQTFTWDVSVNDGTGQIRFIAQAYESGSAVAPLGGVNVSIIGGNGSSGGSSLSRALTTGDSGIVWLPDLPQGEYTLTLENAPYGYTALEGQAAFAIEGGEETSLTLVFTKDAQVTVNRKGRVIDASGAVSLTELSGTYIVYNDSDNAIGQTDDTSRITLPAAPEGSQYTFKEVEPADGFQPDPAAHSVTVYPGEEITLDTFADSAQGLFTLLHENPSGISVTGGSFDLISLDDPDWPTLSFSMGDRNYYEAEEPLPAGRYQVRLTEAAGGYMADPVLSPLSLEFTIEPYLNGAGAVRSDNLGVAFISMPIPDDSRNVAAPTLTLLDTELNLSNEQQTHLTITPANPALPVRAAELTLGMNYEAGVSFSGIDVTSVDGVSSARVFISDGSSWTDEGILALPGSIYWDDVRETVRFIRIVLAGEELLFDTSDAVSSDIIANKPFPPSEDQVIDTPPVQLFSLDGFEVEAHIRALPRLAVDALITVSASARIETPVQTAESQWRIISSQSSATDRIGLITPRKLSQGSVFEDRDMDRIRGSSDSGVPLVRVIARDSSGNTIAQAVTDSDGAFAFDGQVPSNAVLSLSFDGLYERTAARYAVLGQSGWRFALLPESVLTGSVSGLESLLSAVGSSVSTTESPLNTAESELSAADGIRVELWRNGSLAAQTTVDSSGSFRIGGLAPGEYSLNVILPAGYLAIDPPKSVELPYGGSVSVTLAAQRAASLTGRVMAQGIDAADQTRTSARLTQLPNGAAYEIRVSEDGSFTLDTIDPGEYTLRWLLPDNAALESGVPSTETITLQSGETLERNITIVPGATINGLIVDHQGAAVSSVSIRLTASDGSTRTATTDNEGRFMFNSLAAGSYSLEPKLPDGMILHSGDTQFSVTVGEFVHTEWTAFIPASVSGTVWRIGGNGAEPLSGIQVTAADTDGNALLSTITDADGAFAFDGLRPGKARLIVGVPDEMALTQPKVDTAITFIPPGPEQSGSILSEPFTLSPGQALNSAHIGLVQVTAIEATVWQDRNDNGQRDSADLPLGGIVVTLIKDGKPSFTQTTDARGIVTFERVRPDVYSITVDVPENFAPSVGIKITDGQPLWQVQVGYDSTTVHAQLPLTPLSDITGTARRTDGLPVQGLTARAVAVSGDTTAEAVSDETGVLTLARLRPGEYSVTFTLPTGSWAFENSDGPSVTQSLIVGDNAHTITIPPLTELCSITGSVYVDTNGDGLKGDDEQGASNVELIVLDSSGQTLFNRNTDAQGSFTADQLRPGLYTVSMSLPDNALPMNGYSSWSITLSMGETASVGAIGIYESASVQVSMSDETNAPLSGVQWSLSRSDTLVGSAVTADDGKHLFSGLKPGDYTITALLPDGYLFISDAESEPIMFTLRSGEALNLNRSSAVKSASVSGRVWMDSVYDGLPSYDEPPLSGVMITLVDSDGNAVRQVRTSENGSYLMDALRPDEYRLHAALPNGLIFTMPTSQTNQTNSTDQPSQPDGGSVMPAVTGRQAFSDTFTLSPGQALEGMGVGALTAAVISGETYIDANADGQRGFDETPLTGVTVTLTDESENGAAVTTSADGRYQFDSLRPGNYTLVYDWPDDYVDTGVQITQVTLSMGQTRDDLRAGSALPCSVSGIVFEDVDADGLHGNDEPPIPDVSVTVRTSHGIFSGITDEFGAYQIDGLLPGSASVSFQLPDGMMFTRQREGGSMAITTDDSVSSSEPLTLVMGGKLSSINAGAVRSGTVGDFAWIDSNLNGMQDYNESGVPDLTLTLERAADGQWVAIGEAVTDINGYYEFIGVRPGTYRVLVSVPEGMIPTRRVEGLPEIDSKLEFKLKAQVEVESNDPMVTDLILVESGRKVRNADIGLVRSADAWSAGWQVQGGGEITAP
ncbi:hypothetical protein FACS1894184_00850 [Clostridia bacterium]|nr:hypothetical protein FACS1894184_00850 [Clostridia bacterium]